jgi:hypothetical protein
LKTSIANWQQKLLPLMASMLVAAALFFAVVSLFEYSDFKNRVASPEPDLAKMFERFEQTEQAKATVSRFDYLQWKSLVFLEQGVISHRYAQVNATILARVWTRLMGFITGMLLAIVGSAFILGKLREQPTELRQETEALKFSLATSSPGIVLAVLGSFLMSITLLTKFDIDVRDLPAYVSAPAPASELPDPAKLIAPENRTAPQAGADARPADPKRDDPKRDDPRYGGTP